MDSLGPFVKPTVLAAYIATVPLQNTSYLCPEGHSWYIVYSYRACKPPPLVVVRPSRLLSGGTLEHEYSPLNLDF